MRKLLYLASFVIFIFQSNYTNAQCTLTTSATVVTNASCVGIRNGSAATMPSGGTVPYTYLWNDVNTQITDTAGGLSAGSYTVTVTDNTGCIATASVTISQPNLLGASANVIANVSCNGASNGSVSAIPSGGTSPFTYLWSDPNNQSTITATGLSAGSYTVNVYDSCGGTTTATAIVSQPDTLGLTATVTANADCIASGSDLASASGGTAPYTYVWNDPNNQTTAAATGLSTGNYTVTVMDNNGCSATFFNAITQLPALSATASVTANPECSANGSVLASVSGGASPYTYMWSDANNQTTVMATGLSAGTYTVTVTDNNGCSTTVSDIVTQLTALSITANVTANVTCNGGSNGTATASVSGGLSPYTYSWSNGETMRIANGLSAGNYMVTVTDNNGCIATGSNTITQPVAFVVAINPIIDIVGADSCYGELAVTFVSGGVAPFTFLWNDPSQQPTDTAAGLCSDSTYCVIVTDANQCNATICGQILVTGIQNISNASRINIYPDPNNGYFTVTGVTHGQIVEVYNYLGQNISSVKADNPTMYFDISTKANGVYLIRIQNADGTVVTEKKIIKTL